MGEDQPSETCRNPLLIRLTGVSTGEHRCYASRMPLTTAKSGSPEVPASILAGVYEAAAKHLGVANVRHRSALAKVQLSDAAGLFAVIHEAVCHNYVASNASANKDRSSENWRWHSPQPQISAHNTSPEVAIERAVARAAVALGRSDWSNQVPVASGLLGGVVDRRRAIDLVRQTGERHFQFIELKIASDTPLYAAVELLGYASLWLIARSDPPSKPSVLLAADTVDLRVLAPAPCALRTAASSKSSRSAGNSLMGLDRRF